MKFFCELKKAVDDSYDIEIGRGLSDTLISDIKNGLCGRIKKFAVVTDSIVEPLYAKGIYEKLISAGYSADMFVIPEGEKSKTRAMKEFVEDAMLEKGYRRDCCVIAVGGGVVSDLAGFVAGTFGRGVPFINYATTGDCTIAVCYHTILINGNTASRSPSVDFSISIRSYNRSVRQSCRLRNFLCNAI